jgi:hypothetical protein
MPRTRVTFVEKVIISDIPDGVYDGLWSGYSVTVVAQDAGYYHIHTEDGVRGTDVPVTVIVSNGVITIE